MRHIGRRSASFSVSPRLVEPPVGLLGYTTRRVPGDKRDPAWGFSGWTGHEQAFSPKWSASQAENAEMLEKTGEAREFNPPPPDPPSQTSSGGRTNPDG